MTIEEALEFFEDIPAIYDRLKTLVRWGSVTSSSAKAPRRFRVAKHSASR
jgi:hypothetical protein